MRAGNAVHSVWPTPPASSDGSQIRRPQPANAHGAGTSVVSRNSTPEPGLIMKWSLPIPLPVTRGWVRACNVVHSVRSTHPAKMCRSCPHPSSPVRGRGCYSYNYRALSSSLAQIINLGNLLRLAALGIIGAKPPCWGQFTGFRSGSLRILPAFAVKSHADGLRKGAPRAASRRRLWLFKLFVFATVNSLAFALRKAYLPRLVAPATTGTFYVRKLSPRNDLAVDARACCARRLGGGSLPSQPLFCTELLRELWSTAT
jgi:hypothetical protein